MEVLYNIDKFKAQNPVVTVGTFDGVHVGHKKLLKNLVDSAKAINGSSVVFTFLEHPRKILFPESKPELIHTVEEKIIVLEQLGIDCVIFFNFSKEFANMTADEFTEKILVEKLKIKKLIVGFNHQFGKSRLGNFERLQILSEKFDFQLQKVDAELDNEIAISSSKIRNSLHEGDVLTANKYLGYNYFIKGKVVEGNKLGRKIGFPTANVLYTEEKLLPKIGVYAVIIEIDNKRLSGMANIGFRPTFEFEKPAKTIEVNIFNFKSNIYNNKIIIHFIERIRDEIKFDKIENLQNQLYLDKKSALEILNSDASNF